jgi:hypothetical protein
MRPVGVCFHPVCRDYDRVSFDAAQVVEDLFGVGVLTFAEVVVPKLPVLVQHVAGRPVVVVEGAPDLMVVVDRHGVVDAGDCCAAEQDASSQRPRDVCRPHGAVAGEAAEAGVARTLFMTIRVPRPVGRVPSPG